MAVELNGPWPSMIGKNGIAQGDAGPRMYEVIGEVRRLQSNASTKLLVLQKLKWADDGTEELRSGFYYWTGDQWRWSRFSQMAPARDFAALVKEAVKEGWIRVTA